MIRVKPPISTSSRIPSSLKHNVWLLYIGKKFEEKCTVTWCNNIITPFTFEAGHNIPFSKGGATTIDNLRPICSNCNKSMGNYYTIDEYSSIFNKKDTCKHRIITINKLNIESTSTISKNKNIFDRLKNLCCILK